MNIIDKYPEIARRITSGEYREVVERAFELGLTNLAIQGNQLMVSRKNNSLHNNRV